MADSKPFNLRDALMPVSVVVGIVGGALVMQARLLAVEYAVTGLKDYILQRDEIATERLRLFANTMREMNPTIKVPEIR
jgi:hypothetical protein